MRLLIISITLYKLDFRSLYVSEFVHSRKIRVSQRLSSSFTQHTLTYDLLDIQELSFTVCACYSHSTLNPLLPSENVLSYYNPKHLLRPELRGRFLHVLKVVVFTTNAQNSITHSACSRTFLSCYSPYEFNRTDRLIFPSWI